MRLKVEITDLTQDEWEQAQRTLKTSYDIPDGASRACLILIHGDEERHVETPVGVLSSLLTGLNLGSAFRGLSRAIKTAMAALTPDDDRLPADRPVVVKNTGAATATGAGSFVNTGYVGKDPDA